MQQKIGKTVYRLKTKRDLMVQYGDDEGLVNEIIASKRKQGLASKNPECPHRADQDLFYCLDEMSMAENHILEHSQEMRGETEIDKELTKQLFNGSAFGDKAVPLRSGHPLAVWDKVSSGVQSGESHEIELIPAAVPKAGAPTPASGDSSGTAVLALQSLLAQSGYDKAQQNEAVLALCPWLSEKALPPPPKNSSGEASGVGEKSRRKSGGKSGGPKASKAKVKAPENPLSKGVALQQEVVKEKQAVAKMKNELKSIAASDSIQKSLASHEVQYKELYDEMESLVSDGENTEQGWADVTSKAAALKEAAKATLGMADDVLKGHIKRVKASEGGGSEKKKAKTR